jgi:hypothetical protein
MPKPDIIPKDIRPSSDTDGKGVIYLATGDEYLRLAIQSISFLRQFGYLGPVRVLTDSAEIAVDDPRTEFITLPTSRKGHSSRFYKTQLFDYAFPNTLFLDADTVCVGSIDDIWMHLSDHDICMASDNKNGVGGYIDRMLRRQHESRLTELTYMNTDYWKAKDLYNSGVILFRSCPVIKKLFEVWHEEWGRFSKIDQLALVRALERTIVNPGLLSSKWNYRANRIHSISDAQDQGQIILHFLGRQRPLMDRYLKEWYSMAVAHSPRSNDINDAYQQNRSQTRLIKPVSLGIVYIAFGDIYRELTCLSIASLRRYGYEGQIRVLTNQGNWKIDQLGCEFVVLPTDVKGFGTRHYKTQLTRFGFDTTLFLDADTLAIAPISHIWRELQFAEIAMPQDIHPTVRHLLEHGKNNRERRRQELRLMDDLDLLDETFFNSGIILYRRCPAVNDLFTTWHEEWLRFCEEDQPALVRAISRLEVNVHMLSQRWNTRLKRYGSISKAQNAGERIIHLRPGQEPALQSIFDEYANEGFLTPSERVWK